MALTVRDSMSIVLAACAIIVTALVVRKEFFGPSPRILVDGVEGGDPVPVADWDSLLTSGHWKGLRDAPVVILTYSDFECPACRAFVLTTLDTIQRKYGDSLAVVFRHWPLDYHRFAMPAARAAECAAVQGRFWEFHDLVYLKQDSLGLKQFSEFASEAGVADTSAYRECVEAQSPLPQVQIDAASARQVGGRGTPTVLVNGRRFPRPPTASEIIRLVESQR
jgi:protein-disulfide isomerase